MADVYALVRRAVVLRQQVSTELVEGKIFGQVFRPYIAPKTKGIVVDGAGERGVG